MSNKQSVLEAMLGPVIEGMGLECWGIEFISQGKHSVLRIYIDSDAGIKLEDCERVSRQISGVLDVEDPIATEYTLEVSSPGMDRPLFKLAQFERFSGNVVMVKLRMAFEGKRKYQGILKGIEGDEIVLQIDEHELLLPYELIDKANIVA